ncbi:alkaline shock response membrane anchor protein AmaP [Haloechinothrix sp. LS1_15]|uniref:alkaline shock response membrane anchor protein AmaP n=1 Tax=Haloechinothrix sp. LS1_15 TaxID=2652248 RepID=UPI002947E5E3|nr:alkaline shock response membrane anchor protein AmaP [Haloechinothrix sp. LS1_15]MDV6011398.1 alkaline shock response membrane anchor protein AmaP [Haloechinothrix sp. LS1_15]
MSRTPARKAMRRSAGAERSLTFLVGLVLLAAGATALAIGYDLAGLGWQQRPVLGPDLAGQLAIRPEVARLAVIAGGLVLALIALWWLLRMVRPESSPDFTVTLDDDARVTVRSRALAEAVRSDVARIDGVGKARVRTAGDVADPVLRLTVWLRDGADLAEVWRVLDGRVLADARETLGRESLPTAIRLQMSAARRERVR